MPRLYFHRLMAKWYLSVICWKTIIYKIFHMHWEIPVTVNSKYYFDWKSQIPLIHKALLPNTDLYLWFAVISWLNKQLDQVQIGRVKSSTSSHSSSLPTHTVSLTQPNNYSTRPAASRHNTPGVSFVILFKWIVRAIKNIFTTMLVIWFSIFYINKGKQDW